MIVLQENNHGSTAATFAKMIDEAGLQTVFVNNEVPQLTPDHRFFYLGIMHKGATPPDWAKRAAAKS